MAGKSGKIGILALQGDISLHEQSLKLLGIGPIFIRLPKHLDGLDGLIIPGGESTALLKLAEPIGILKAITDFAASGCSIFGTCAGAIILAKKVTNPAQQSLGLLDITIERNSYGRQLDSTETTGQALEPLGKGELPMVFIRAPRIISVGASSTILAKYQNDPVLVRQNNILVATFHPELTGDLTIYKYWLDNL